MAAVSPSEAARWNVLLSLPPSHWPLSWGKTQHSDGGSGEKSPFPHPCSLTLSEAPDLHRLWELALLERDPLLGLRLAL